MSFYSSIVHANKVAMAVCRLVATSVTGFYLIKNLMEDKKRTRERR